MRRLGIVSTADDPNDDSVIINNPPPFVRGIPYIKDLAEYISGKLSTYKEIKTSPDVPANRTGSSTQIGYVEVLPSGILEDYLRHRKLTEQEIETFAAHQLAVKPGSAIPVMKYRVNRRSTIAYTSPEVFPFSFPANIPNSWHAHINTYPVCKQMFLNTMGVGERSVLSWVKKM